MFFLDVFTTTGACVSLASLHRLSIDSRIQYKLASVCYNCLNSTHPGNLTELLRREEIRSVCLHNGLNESSGFMSDTSAKIVELESVKQLSAIPLNSVSQGQT